MSAVDAAQSGTASALMGTLMFVFGGIAAPLAGLGGETMLKMSLAMAICYLLALLMGLSQPRSALNARCGNKIFHLYYRTISRHLYHSRIILRVLIVILFTCKE